MFPPTGGESKSLKDIAGVYDDQGCAGCTTNVIACCDDAGCATFSYKGCPMSCTPVCKAGDNTWANFQGFCMSYGSEPDKLVTGWMGCYGKPMPKKGGAPPSGEEMQR